MDGQQCDRHPSARAKARVLLPSLNQLYMCGHCVDAMALVYKGDCHIQYETVTLNAKG